MPRSSAGRPGMFLMSSPSGGSYVYLAGIFSCPSCNPIHDSIGANTGSGCLGARFHEILPFSRAGTTISSKIMTKFKDKPYSYELLPEYANGSKKFPTVKSMNWEGKTATAKVIRGFTESTPVAYPGGYYGVLQVPPSTR
jgi:hypothetical protein